MVGKYDQNRQNLHGMLIVDFYNLEAYHQCFIHRHLNKSSPSETLEYYFKRI